MAFRILLCLNLILFSSCSEKNSVTEVAPAPTQITKGSRGIASVNEIEFPPAIAQKFLTGKKQFLKPGDIKSFKKNLPIIQYENLLSLSEKVSQKKFSVQRDNSKMILKNEKAELTIDLVGKNLDLFFVFDSKKYDLLDSFELKRMINVVKKGVGSSIPVSFLYKPFKVCSALFLLTAPREAFAMGNWFFIGGMAILAIGIVYAASKFGKSLQNTTHTVNTNSTVSGTVNGRVSGDVTGKLTANPETVDALEKAIKESADDLKSRGETIK